jgi:RNA polymerase sigma-70 factor (ECF subfamily)
MVGDGSSERQLPDSEDTAFCGGWHDVALSEIDRNLLERCLSGKPRAWEDFVDRFMGLVVHVINHTAQSRSVRLMPEDREDLIGDVFLTVVKDDFAVLRQFRGNSSLATYLTVIARRVAVHQLLKRKNTATLTGDMDGALEASNGHSVEKRLSNHEEISRLLEELEGTEAEIVRLYHLEGKSYHEISSTTGMPENSIGPTLSRAREKMRRASVDQPTG